MSAAPAYSRIQDTRRHATRPQPQKRARSRRKNEFWPNLVTFSLLFSATTVLSFGFSTLTGCSIKESASREAVRANERAKAARADLARIRTRVDRLTTLREVDKWSKENLYVAAFQFAKKSAASQPAVRPTLLAKRDAGLRIDILATKVESGFEAQ